MTPGVGQEGTAQPHDEAEQGDDGHQDEPEPQEAEDLLVEEVDGQGALERPPLHVVQLTDLKVTQRHLYRHAFCSVSLFVQD